MWLVLTKYARSATNLHSRWGDSMNHLMLRAGAKFLAMSISYLLFAAWPNVAFAQAPLKPKIILQTLPYGGVEIAAWTIDDRYLVTAVSASRTVLIIDAKAGTIVDRLVLPSDNVESKISARRLTAMRATPDGRSILIEGEVVYPEATTAEDLSTTLTYDMDLATRQITLRPSSPPSARGVSFTTVNATLGALEAYYERVGDMTPEAAEAALLRLPASNDGKLTLRRDPTGLLIEEAGQEPRKLLVERPVRFADAALAPNGELLAMLLTDLEAGASDNEAVSVVDIFNVNTGQYLPPVKLTGNYSQIQWLSEVLFLATEMSEKPLSSDTSGAYDGPPVMAMMVDALGGDAPVPLEPRCFLAPSLDAKLFGAGLANCRTKAGKDFALQSFDFDAGKWVPFGKLKLEKGMTVDALAVSATGKTVAVAVTSRKGTSRLVVLDALTGEIVKERESAEQIDVSKLSLLDDEMLFAAGNGGSSLWMLAIDDLLDLQLGTSIARMADSDWQTIAVGGPIDDVIGLFDFETEKTLPPLDYGNIVAGGFLLDRPVFWALSGLDGLRMWNTKDWSILQTTYFFAEQGFLAVTPDGRYDTNLGPDANQFRWLVADRPYQSLAAQTFMRDYFVPGLTERLTTCSILENCATAFEPVKPIADLNRVLPVVTITDIKPGETPDQAIVSVEFREGVDPLAVAGKSKSGLFNPRLFRNFRFAAHTPDEPFELQDTIEDWRKLNRIPDDDDTPGDGVYHLDATLNLPTAAGQETQQISVYAFNEDRVKSDTAYFEYTRPKMEPRRPRAFVISIGIDAYTQSRLNLDYAAADARLLGNRLADIDGYEMRRLVVAGERGSKTRVTADAIAMILALLGGAQDRAEGLKLLADHGIDGSVLDVSTPDDIIIFSYSGHGWAQPKGDFFLVPADGKWPDGQLQPDVGSLISSSELTMWLRLIDAADIALIIDACHSGASVDSGKFRPGPMGDSGLGQLAYDKGIRILAATQADDVALENAKLKQGLLSFALAADGEGLSNPDGAVDLNGDGKLSLNEWMFYPTWRLASLNDDKRVTGGGDDAESSFEFPGRKPAPIKKVQSPSLFDFTVPSAVVVKAVGK